MNLVFLDAVIGDCRIRRRRIEVCRLDVLVFDAQQSRVELRRQFGREIGGDRPVFGFDECLNLALAFDDHAQSDRLHAARRQPAAHLVPQQRRDLIADDAVEQAPRLLRIDEVFINVCRMPERFLYRRLGNLVEEHAAHGLPVLAASFEFFLDVPADGLAFAVRVSGDINRISVFSGGLQFADDFLFAGNDSIRRLKVIIEIDADALLGQILDVADRSQHRKIASEILIDGFCF